MSAKLPDFSDPPVVEVALAAQFDPLSELRTPQVGLLWQKFRDRFPNLEEHAPLDSVIERFGITGSADANVRLEMMKSPPVPRVWFLNISGTELIQVQQDRFIHNWRRAETDEGYPHYEHVRTTFEENWRIFESFCDEEGLDTPSPNQCEVTYVNHIIAGKGWEWHGDLGNVLTLFSPTYSEPFLPRAEGARFACRYVIPNEGGKPVGRLHVSVDSAYRRSDSRAILVLNMVARGRPVGNGLGGVLRFMDLGHEWIVRGFASITTKQMHKIWGRLDDR